MHVRAFYVGNDMVVEVANLRNPNTGVFVNNAQVECTLYDSEDLPVDGGTWPMTLNYVESSDGVYRATLPYDLDVIVDQRYVARVIASAVGLRSQWDLNVVCKYRRL